MPTYSLKETIRILAEIGYDAVEIGCCAPHAWPDHLSKDDRKEIAKAAKGEDIAISSLLPAMVEGLVATPAQLWQLNDRLQTIII